jgi:hypothetical protein
MATARRAHSRPKYNSWPEMGLRFAENGLHGPRPPTDCHRLVQELSRDHSLSVAQRYRAAPFSPASLGSEPGARIERQAALVPPPCLHKRTGHGARALASNWLASPLCTQAPGRHPARRGQRQSPRSNHDLHAHPTQRLPVAVHQARASLAVTQRMRVGYMRETPCCGVRPATRRTARTEVWSGLLEPRKALRQGTHQVRSSSASSKSATSGRHWTRFWGHAARA